jgi:hypothetical protein
MLISQPIIVYKNTYTNAFSQLNKIKFYFSAQKHMSMRAPRELHSR